MKDEIDEDEFPNACQLDFLREEVILLVRSARAVVDVGFPTHECEHGPAIDALQAALKPFLRAYEF